MADRAGVSRAAVGKAVERLRRDGFAVEGIPNEGYRLTAVSPDLSVAGIESALAERWRTTEVIVLDEVRSTNDVMKMRWTSHDRPCLIVAETQTAGRGRRGRTFFSPHGTGLYMSLGVRWDHDVPPTLVTAMAAVAGCRALERSSPNAPDVGIKWVNDLYVGRRKVGGILTEALTTLETRDIDAVVIGIGLNVNAPKGGFPDALRDIAGALYGPDVTIDRNRLAADIVNALGDIFDRLPSRDYLDTYRERCFVLGRRVTLDSGETVIPESISDDGALCYRRGGVPVEVTSGEVRIADWEDRP